MSNRSKISRLSKQQKLQIDIMLANGATIDELLSYAESKGLDISRSSIGRYSQQAKADVIAKISSTLDLSEAMGEGIGLDRQNKQHQHILAMLNAIIHNRMFDTMHNDEQLTPKDLAMLGRTIKDAIFSAEKLEDIKKQARAEALKEAALKAENVLNEKLDNKNQAADVLKAIKEAYGA